MMKRLGMSSALAILVAFVALAGTPNEAAGAVANTDGLAIETASATDPGDPGARVECYYCFDGGGGWQCCQEVVQEYACGESSGCGYNGCHTCEWNEQEQEEEVEVTLTFDGHLSAPGTSIDGLDPRWLGLTAKYVDSGLVLREGCRSIPLRASQQVIDLQQ